MLVLFCESGNTSLAAKNSRNSRKRLFHKYEKSETPEFDRYSLTVNGKNCYVISAGMDFYLSGNTDSLLKAFSGRVLAAGQLIELPCVKDNLFDIMPFYKKYAAVYFAESLKTLCTSASTAAFFDRSGKYIKYIQPAFSYFKAFDFYTDSVCDYSGLINRCYSEYGFKPRFYGFNECSHADIAADIDTVSPGGLLSVSVLNEPRILSASYPSCKFNAEAMLLLHNKINRDYITAAFYDNDL